MPPRLHSLSQSLYILSGQTAVGKTALSLDWAERHDAEIVSCDSLLFYRGMDIGTAKPTRAERSRVAHHAIDVVEVLDPFNVERYVELVTEVIADIHRRGKRVLITGGSGFYLKAFFAPVTDALPIADPVRERVAALFAEGGNQAVIEALKAIPGNDLAGLDLKNPRRTTAALERCWSSGLTLTAQRGHWAAQVSPFESYSKQVCVLTRSRETLFPRIEQRVEAMLESGLIDEVQRLIPTGLLGNTSASRAIGYREVIEWLDSGSRDPMALKEKIVVNTRRLARRQRTWLRHQIPVDQMLDLDAISHEEALNLLFSSDLVQSFSNGA